MIQKPLTAGDLCIRTTVIAPRSMPLNEAARLMREQHVGCLVMVEQTPAGVVPTGMLTDRDIVTAVVAKNVDARSLRVEDVTGSEFVAVREPDSVLDVLRTMRRKGVRRVPVTDAQGVLQGVLALDDLVEAVAEQLGALVQAMSREHQREIKARP